MDPTKWAVLTPDGTLTIHSSEPEYETIKNSLGGGYLEAIIIPTPPMTMYIDEDGKYKQLLENPYATKIARPYIFAGDWIAGIAVFVGLPDEEGYDTGLSTYTLEMLKLSADIIVEVD